VTGGMFLTFGMLVYFCGRFVDKSQALFSPDERGLVFGDGIYEVVRAYNGRWLRWDEHMRRLGGGLEQLRITGADISSFREIASRLLRENSLEQGEATVYLQITRGVAPRAHQFPPAGTPPTIYLEAKSFAPTTAAQRDGGAVVVVPDQRWARCDLKTTNLLPNILAFQTAREAGALEALFSRDGVLMEGSRSSMLFVKNGTVFAPPLNNYILGGITRELVLELAAAEKIPVALQPTFQSELLRLEEMMIIGTTTEITPVISVDGRPVADGKPGPVTRRLQTALRKFIESM
jgi:D-alanine transaminase